jgi:hypothetical protein
VKDKHIYNKRIMDNTKAIQYDNLLREYQKLENQLARVPKLSIEDQSKEIMVGVEYDKTNQKKVNFINQKMREASSLMMSLY